MIDQGTITCKKWLDWGITLSIINLGSSKSSLNFRSKDSWQTQVSAVWADWMKMVYPDCFIRLILVWNCEQLFMSQEGLWILRYSNFRVQMIFAKPFLSWVTSFHLFHFSIQGFSLIYIGRMGSNRMIGNFYKITIKFDILYGVCWEGYPGHYIKCHTETLATWVALPKDLGLTIEKLKPNIFCLLFILLSWFIINN